MPPTERRLAADDRGDLSPKRPRATDAPAKEVIADISWVVVTGVVDHHAIQEAFAMAGIFRAITPENLYRRVDLERQVRSQEGWSDWRSVDPEPTARILDNLPEVESERTPDAIRPDRLVDHLPFLKAGMWTGVDPDRFVAAMNDERAGRQAGEVAPVPDDRGATPPVLMLRQFDFTIEPGKVYRYRARLVVDDGRWRRKEIASAWSDPTNPVTVPTNGGADGSGREVP